MYDRPVRLYRSPLELHEPPEPVLAFAGVAGAVREVGEDTATLSPSTVDGSSWSLRPGQYLGRAANVEAHGPDDAEQAHITDPLSAESLLAGGRLLSAISTAIVKLMREHYGRGPLKAKTYALDDIIVCVLRGAGFTPLEQTIMDSGDGSRVIAMRENFQEMMATRYKEMIERLTGRKVLAFLSQAHVEPDITLEVFFVDRPLDGFGAVEVLDAPKPPAE
jgi:uncharacterized protein YbcI